MSKVLDIVAPQTLLIELPEGTEDNSSIEGKVIKTRRSPRERLQSVATNIALGALSLGAALVLFELGRRFGINFGMDAQSAAKIASDFNKRSLLESLVTTGVIWPLVENAIFFGGLLLADNTVAKDMPELHRPEYNNEAWRRIYSVVVGTVFAGFFAALHGGNPISKFLLGYLSMQAMRKDGFLSGSLVHVTNNSLAVLLYYLLHEIGRST